MKLKLVLEYDGGGFSGWQRQPNVNTVQEELEKACLTYASSIAKQAGVEVPDSIAITGSGRTDAGVHAKGQVASLSWPEGLPVDTYKMQGSLNGLTAPELVVKNISEVDDSFDARHSAHVKCYKYYLLNRPGGEGLYRGSVWHIPQELDVTSMVLAARLFQGTHDFSSFRASDCVADTTVRTILLSELVRKSREILVYTVMGKGFLKQMVRTLAGTLVEVGQGKRKIQDIPDIIAAKDRTRAGVTAPAEGLVLEWVRYEGE